MGNMERFKLDLLAHLKIDQKNKTSTYVRAKPACVRFVTTEDPHVLIILISAEQTTRIMRLRVHDNVHVEIPALDDRTRTTWHGVVVPPMKQYHPLHCMIRATQPFDDEFQVYKGLEATQLALGQKIPFLGDLGDAHSEVKASIDQQVTQQVKISVIENFRGHVRHKLTLDQVDKMVLAEKGLNGISATEELVLCRQFDCLPVTNLFEGVSAESYANIRSQFSDEQSIAFDGVKILVGGLSLVRGTSGSDTAGLSSKVGSIFAQNSQKGISVFADVAESRTSKGSNMLVVTTTNCKADDMMASFQHDLRNIDPSMLIVRKYATKTSRSMFEDNHLPRMRSLRPDLNNTDSAIRGLADTQDLEHHHRTKNGFQDSRVTPAGRALSDFSWIALAYDLNGVLIDSNYHSEACVKRLQDALDPDDAEDLRSKIRRYNQAVNRDIGYGVRLISERTQKIKEQLFAELDDAFDWLYNMADVVVTTANQACDPSLTRSFRPRLIIADGMDRATPIDSLFFVWYPDCKARIFIGDGELVNPTRHGPRQPEASFFNRLCRGGFPSLVELDG